MAEKKELNALWHPDTDNGKERAKRLMTPMTLRMSEKKELNALWHPDTENENSDEAWKKNATLVSRSRIFYI